jgi:hypothetical protein
MLLKRALKRKKNKKTLSIKKNYSIGSPTRGKIPNSRISNLNLPSPVGRRKFRKTKVTKGSNLLYNTSWRELGNLNQPWGDGPSGLIKSAGRGTFKKVKTPRKWNK